MTLPRILRTASFRFAMIYAALFMASVSLLGLIVYTTVRSALETQLSQQIETEATSLAAEYTASGLGRLLAAVSSRDELRGADTLEYSVVGERGVVLAGRRLRTPEGDGWLIMKASASAPRQGSSSLVMYTVTLDNDVRLLIASDPSWIDRVQHAILIAFGWAIAATLLLALASGLWLSARFLRGMDAVMSTAQAVMAGNMTSRVALSSRNDDFDHLGSAFNSMLNRLGGLMESLKQVSTDIAHDLRTPLSRLKQSLETVGGGQVSIEEMRSGIADATAQVDEILSTFSALLRIAQVESGTRRSGFETVDLSELTETVAVDFAAVAEGKGQSMATRIDPGIRIDGDRELLTQLLVNLIENAIRHTQEGSHIRIDVSRLGETVALVVADNGPGVEEADRERIFERFFRSERSRTTPGNGLGLHLVKAVAELHRGSVAAFDCAPGLGIRVSLPSAMGTGS
ncbi:MAG: HAMP domain-containing histidine kinase [Beijerinckiaceae bacterium]|nr:HAMP domain-containing histidine kinase [Beijerinckiaceae bacterium]